MIYLLNVIHQAVSFYQTPQTCQTVVRIECQLTLIIANKELLYNNLTSQN